ncbi:hypothetical protein TEQG_08651 [Trichophyton equinum CBS 127.97]|uniref:Uncharacterized protein n=1 Tax=Trichophyton equinum (strain ATCC MYA-4606 / CBS 127.97) TaxID=559882 RepID=F2PQL9_TRIEC|nr:hypothetical protein TEQG_08651 [Trichophyton equinum CBS 127.97]
MIEDLSLRVNVVGERCMKLRVRLTAERNIARFAHTVLKMGAPKMPKETAILRDLRVYILHFSNWGTD